MSEQRVTLVETPTGRIELLLERGMFSVLQFNCSCVDALPYCKAMCCRLRSLLTSPLLNDELVQYEHRTVETAQGPLHVLPSKPTDDSCVHLDDRTHRCQIHDTKPVNCGNWHCSPGGVGQGLTFRDKGWFLSPMGALQRG